MWHILQDLFGARDLLLLLQLCLRYVPKWRDSFCILFTARTANWGIVFTSAKYLNSNWHSDVSHTFVFVSVCLSFSPSFFPFLLICAPMCVPSFFVVLFCQLIFTARVLWYIYCILLNTNPHLIDIFIHIYFLLAQFCFVIAFYCCCCMCFKVKAKHHLGCSFLSISGSLSHQTETIQSGNQWRELMTLCVCIYRFSLSVRLIISWNWQFLKPERMTHSSIAIIIHVRKSLIVQDIETLNKMATAHKKKTDNNNNISRSNNETSQNSKKKHL